MDYYLKNSGLIFLICLATALFQPISAQDFQEGLDLYNNGQYEKSASVFKQIQGPKARLFEGKSYFGQGRYLKAKSLLSTLDDSNAVELYHEALYTSALADFQLKQYGSSLSKLHTLSREKARTPIINESIRFYNDILHFLTLNQRKEAFQFVENSRIKFDLIRTAMGKVSFSTARLLVKEFKISMGQTPGPDKLKELEEIVSDSMSYAMEIAFGNKLRAPQDITYNIGAALPQYQPGDRDFEVSQGLHYGYVLAAEEFNRDNNDKKAFIRFKNTGGSRDSAQYLMTDLAWNYQVDAVLGPLYSEPVNQMARLAELFEVPMIAPLANSDTLNIDNPYLFQANPTFSSHGRKMAEYAVKKLEMDTLAVLAEEHSLGESSAYAFREEAEKLGAKVAYFFVEDLESQGYEITDYTKYFTGDSLKADSLKYQKVDGLYAPFTGQVAPTLIDLLLIDLAAMDSPVTVLGSQEWGATEIAEDRLGDRTVYFSESYYMNTASDRLKQFKERYKSRFGIEANRFAMIGYDAASYLLQTLAKVENPALLKYALSRQPLYEGLISNLKFEGTHVNQEVKIFKLSSQGIFPSE